MSEIKFAKTKLIEVIETSFTYHFGRNRLWYICTVTPRFYIKNIVNYINIRYDNSTNVG